MALMSQNLFTSPTSRNTAPKIPNFPISLSSKPFANPLPLKSMRTKFQNPVFWEPFRSRRSLLRVLESEGTVVAEKLRIADRNLETFLLISESLCLASSAVLSIGLVVNWVMSRFQKGFLGLLVDGVLAWQVVMLVIAVGIAAWIRRRQWKRLSSSSLKIGSSSEVHFVERIEKLEEDMRSSITIIRVLSRQLEKLGIRFRVTRKALKVPISETAALAQKNSEATRALAVQEDLLEKELGEIQRVLMAMQEQQQKQLELILAVCKSGKLLESKQGSNQERETTKTYKSGDDVKEREPLQTQPLVRHKGANNDRA